MEACSREIHISRHVIAWMNQHSGKNVLSAAALVRGHREAIAVIFAHRGFKVIEILAAGVSLVPKHHARPLPIAHRARAAVGEQIDIHILRAEQKRIVAGFRDGPFALLAGRQLQRLDHFDLPRFRPGAVGGTSPGSLRLRPARTDFASAHADMITGKLPVFQAT